MDALNRADEALTLGTLPGWASVARGEMVATIKVIPFAVPGAALERAIGPGGGRCGCIPMWRGGWAW